MATYKKRLQIFVPWHLKYDLEKEFSREENLDKRNFQ